MTETRTEIEGAGRPIVSVVMPAYNGEPYLKAAVDSILEQSFGDLELIVVDDCSTDGTPDTLRAYADPRLRILRNEVNLGIVGALNRGLSAATGKYVARMDADDISHPDRLARQVAYMDANPGVLLTGTRVDFIDGNGEPLKRNIVLPTDDKAIRLQSAFFPAFVHPTVMIRGETLRRHGLRYVEAFRYAEDYDLWTRIMALGEVANLPEPLLSYRTHNAQISSSKLTDMAAVSSKVSQTYLKTQFGLTLSIAEIETAQRVLFRQRFASRWEPRAYLGTASTIAKMAAGAAKTGFLDSGGVLFFLKLYLRIGRAAAKGLSFRGRSPSLSKP